MEDTQIKEAFVTDKEHGFQVVIDADGDVFFEGPGAITFLVTSDEWNAMVRAVDIARTALATQEP